MSEVLERVEEGREAIRNHRWKEGYELLAAAAADSAFEPADLELLAWSAYFTDEIVQVVPFLERAHEGYVAAGNKVRAAIVAVQLAHEYGSVRLQKAVGSGWFSAPSGCSRASRESLAHGHSRRPSAGSAR